MQNTTKRPEKNIFLLFYALLLTILCMGDYAHAETAEFPIADPYKATIFGTPPELMYKFKEKTSPEKCEIVIERRKIPDIFWYNEEFYYSTAMHDEEAPLLFIVAGTGSEHNSTKMNFLTQLFYEAGFHVVALSSPTHMNFVVSFSKYGAPGYVPHDVEDLYRAMRWIKQNLEEAYKINGYSITGYSLGGLHSAFLSKLDEERHDFNFQRVLMLNPPVSLYSSALRFDSWLSPENLGNKTPRQVVNELIEAFSEIYVQSDIIDLDDNFLYALSQHINFSKMDMKAIIAGAFRMSSASMIFSSDVCLNAGYIVPVNRQLGVTDNLMPYMRVAAAITFEDYIDEYLLPYLQFLKPGTTKGELVKNCDLESIRDYLSNSDKIFVLGNEDDIILNDADVEFLRNTFGERAFLFPHGGHCGNIMFGPFARKAQELIR